MAAKRFEDTSTLLMPHAACCMSEVQQELEEEEGNYRFIVRHMFAMFVIKCKSLHTFCFKRFSIISVGSVMGDRRHQRHTSALILTEICEMCDSIQKTVHGSPCTKLTYIS